VDESTLSRREKTLFRRLREGYTPEIATTVLKPLLDQTSPVSLRVLDWAVVNWAKQHNVVCTSRSPGKMTNIHYAYRRTLGFWKRRLFDPFRRRKRITVRIGDTTYETTLGQANFVLWSYVSGVLAYVLGHIDAIEADANRVSQRQKKERKLALQQGRVMKRKELTSSPSVLCVAYFAPEKIIFEE